jgi:hypothetical protein
MRVGVDDLEALRDITPEGGARQLRLQPYGSDDPIG